MRLHCQVRVWSAGASLGSAAGILAAAAASATRVPKATRATAEPAPTWTRSGFTRGGRGRERGGGGGGPCYVSRKTALPQDTLNLPFEKLVSHVPGNFYSVFSEASVRYS